MFWIWLLLSETALDRLVWVPITLDIYFLIQASKTKYLVADSQKSLNNGVWAPQSCRKVWWRNVASLGVMDEGAPSRRSCPLCWSCFLGSSLGGSFHLGLCLVTVGFLGALSQYLAPFIKSPVDMNIEHKSSLVPYAEIAKFLCWTG